MDRYPDRGIRPTGRPAARWAVPLAVLVALTAFAPSIVTPVHGSMAADSSSVPHIAATSPAHASPSIIIHFIHPTWINVTDSAPGASPPTGGMAAYDPADRETVYFGGCLNSICSVYSNETWVFARGAWINETDPFDAPPARVSAAMDYDANEHSVLLFGGLGTTGALGDTWLFHAGVWTNVTDYGPGPSARYDAQMAFDPQPEENGSVLFGGYTITGYANDTWAWQGGAGWVALTPSLAPPTLCCGAMAYDAADGYLVLYGGYTGLGAATSETWEFYSGQWWAVSPSGPPVARYYTTMTYVPSLSGVLLFGGDESGLEVNDTWLFSNGAWTNESPSAAPPAGPFDAVLDGTGTTALAVGGYLAASGGSETWAYEIGPGALLEANQSAAEVGESVLFTADVASGTAPYNATFNFGDGTGAFVSGTGPEISVPHVFARNGTFDVQVNVTDAVGATTSASPLAFPVAHAPAVVASTTPTSGDVGGAIAFHSDIVTPGTPPYSYAWSFGDGGSATTANTSHTYSAPGVYTVRLNVTDADHATAASSVTVTIAPQPTVSVTPSTTHPPVGTPVTFWANVTGGTAPYSYAWRFADGSSNALPSPDHAFASGGTYVVQVWVNDSAGGAAHGTVTISVSSSSSSSGLGSAPWWFWGGIAAIAAVAILGSVLLVRRGRHTP